MAVDQETPSPAASATKPPAGARKDDKSVSPKELGLVRRVVDKLQVAMKTFLMFPEGNVNVVSTSDAAMHAFDSFFHDYDRLVLDTSASCLVYKGEPLASTIQQTRNISYLMNKDGVMRVVFYRGLERQELLDLMSIFKALSIEESLDDDFVTMLWEKDCTHIQTVAYESLLESANVPDMQSSVPLDELNFEDIIAQKDVESEPEAAEEKEQKQILDEVKADAFNLKPEEQLELAKRVTEAGEAAPLLELVDALFVVHEVEPSTELFEAVLNLIYRTVKAAVAEQHFKVARILLKSLQAKGAQQDAFDSKQQLKIDYVSDRLSEGESLGSITRLLNDQNFEPDEETFEFLKLLKPKAFDALLSVFENGRHIARVGPVLKEMGGADCIQKLLPCLRNENAEVVGAALDLLMEVNPDETAKNLQGLLQHPDAGLRLKALKILEARGVLSAQTQLVALLHDPDEKVRISVLSAMGETAFPSAFDALWDIVDSKQIFELPENQQQLVLNATVRADPEKAAMFFDFILSESRLLFKKRWQTHQRQAIRALASVDHPDLRNMLHEWSRRGTGFVQQLCQIAIAVRPGAPRKPDPSPGIDSQARPGTGRKE